MYTTTLLVLKPKQKKTCELHAKIVTKIYTKQDLNQKLRLWLVKYCYKNRIMISKRRDNMKVLCLMGSQREDGNSTKIADYLLKKLDEKGAQIFTFYLSEMFFKDCQGCLMCKTGLGKCVLRDDLTPVLDKVYEADILIIASPIYFGEVTSPIKSFIDRTFSFYVPDFTTNPTKSRLIPGKKLVFILTQGDTNADLYVGVYKRYSEFLASHQFSQSYLIQGINLNDKNDVLGRADIFQKIDEVAAKL